MDNLQQLMDTVTSNWMTILVVILLFIYVFPDLANKLSFIKKWFGYETKLEKRLKTIEGELVKIKEVQDKYDEKLQNTNQKFQDQQTEHWQQSLVEKRGIWDKLDAIIEKLDKQDNSNFIKLRHEIVQAGEDALERGQITIRKLKSLEELYQEYHDTYDGNSYVQTLMVKVRALPVVGKLNEHGEDIED